MFKVLLVEPRFLLLDVKFFLHNRVRQHPAAYSQSHLLDHFLCRFSPPTDVTPKSNGVGRVSRRSSAPLYARLQPAPVCAHLRTDGRSTLLERCCGRGTFPLPVFKIKAALVARRHPAHELMPLRSVPTDVQQEITCLLVKQICFVFLVT